MNERAERINGLAICWVSCRMGPTLLQVQIIPVSGDGLRLVQLS